MIFRIIAFDRPYPAGYPPPCLPRVFRRPAFASWNLLPPQGVRLSSVRPKPYRRFPFAYPPVGGTLRGCQVPHDGVRTVELPAMHRGPLGIRPCGCLLPETEGNPVPGPIEACHPLLRLLPITVLYCTGSRIRIQLFRSSPLPGSISVDGFPLGFSSRLAPYSFTAPGGGDIPRH
jgi:hypothetical protein